MRVIRIVPVLVILTATMLVASLFAFSGVGSVDAKLPTEELKSIALRLDRVDIVHTTDLAVKGVVITAIDFPVPTVVELLTLQSGILSALGISGLDEGFVTQIRLVVTEATITFNGVTDELKIPAGVVRFNGVVSVPDNDAVFEFDAEKSVIFTPAGFQLKSPIKFDAGPICIDAVTGEQVGTLGDPLDINRPPDNGPMFAESTEIICNLSATIWISPDCQFDIGDAGQLLVYTSGPATITRGLSTLGTLGPAVLSPGDDVHPDDLEPLFAFGLIPIHPDEPGTYVITGIATGVDNPNGAPVDVTIEVIE